MITLNYTITQQEYKDFFYYMGWSSPARRSYRIRYFLTTTIIYFGAMLMMFYINTNSRLNAFTITLTLVIYALFLWYSTTRIRRHYHNYGKKIFEGTGGSPIEVAIGETGIFAKGKDGEAHYKWSAFEKKFETATSYYLYMSSHLGIIIPKRVFKLQKEQEAFEKMLAEYLPLQADLPSITK